MLAAEGMPKQVTPAATEHQYEKHNVCVGQLSLADLDIIAGLVEVCKAQVRTLTISLSQFNTVRVEIDQEGGIWLYQTVPIKPRLDGK